MGINDIKVSFFVTYYNQKEYVSESINSILRIKKPDNWEILVGDDGSSDGTIEEVNKFVSQYPQNIKLFVMPREKGKKYDSVKRASANRLNLLEHASGQYFCVLDGDDYYCDDSFVTEALQIMEENKDISVVAFGYKSFIEDRDLDSHLPCGENKTGVMDKHLYIQNAYTPGGACVHRLSYGKDRIDYLKQIGYFDDNDIIMNSLEFGDVYVFDKVIYAYRQTAGSIYNSMSTVERAVLNTQGFDIDACYIDESYYSDLIVRNAIPIYQAYMYRKKLKKVLGEKFVIYYSHSAEIPGSITYLIMNFDDLSVEDRKRVKSIIRIILRNRPVMIAKMLVKAMLGRL